MTRMPSLVVAAVLALSAPVAADSLYVGAPPPAAPGHPLNINADHRASQVGDVVHILFNFSTTANGSNTTTSANTYNSQAAGGTGIFNLPIIRQGFTLGSSSNLSMNKTQAATEQLTAEMTAVVTNVLPSGELVVSGTQDITVNGDPQTLKITGMVRPYDIDNTDTVLSSLVANVKAEFSGVQTPGQKKSILQKVLGWLFGT